MATRRVQDTRALPNVVEDLIANPPREVTEFGLGAVAIAQTMEQVRLSFMAKLDDERLERASSKEAEDEEKRRAFREKKRAEAAQRTAAQQAKASRSRDRKAATAKVRRAQRYGITVEVLDDLIERQGGECPICGGVPSAIDHDHSCCSGVESCGACVRGVLCSRCNGGLGRFKDDIGLMERAIAYLKDPPAQRP